MGLNLDPPSVILFNVYLVMFVQLVLNWDKTSCDTGSAFFQLGFILIVFTRLLIHEMHNNKMISQKIFTAMMFLMSGVLLVPLAIYQCVVLDNNSDKFYYDAKAKVGN